MSTEQSKPKMDDMAVGNADIVFECPACGKSLIVDETAEGLIVDCPQCRTNVVVPPKPAGHAPTPTPTPTPTPSVTREQSKPRDEAKSSSAGGPPRTRISILADQLKEIQAQRTEITSRIASRLNDVNRDLVMLARLGTSQQQILSEWNQLVEKTMTDREADVSEPTRSVVVGASVGNSDRARVSPRA